MTHLRGLTLVLLLLGQLAVAVQSFAMGMCHDLTAPLAPPHAAHQGAAEHDETPAHQHAGQHTAAHSAGAAHDDCTCASGVHCGHIAVLLMERSPATERPALQGTWHNEPGLATALAHRRDPDRPPAS